MTSVNAFCHCVTTLVAAPSREAFDFLSNPEAVGGWSLGCMQVRRTAEPGLYVGRSLFDEHENWFKIRTEEALLLVDYHTGVPGSLVSRISARVVSAETCDLPSDHCYVTLTTWRSPEMKDDRWQMLCATHEAEIWLIKSQIEAARQDLGRPDTGGFARVSR